jgi:hypothetical protein
MKYLKVTRSARQLLIPLLKVTKALKALQLMKFYERFFAALAR